MWELIWHDEFDGPAGTRPDRQKWTFDVGGNGWGNLEYQYYTDMAENVALDGNGSLVITALMVPNPETSRLECWYGLCRYTSARLLTRGSFEFTYGRVEARLKIPYGQGIWSAFWMLGANIGQNPWPKCGEIDIMENIGREPGVIHGTIHGPGYSRRQGISCPYMLRNGKAFSDDFHKFAIEWEPDVTRWYVDEEQFFGVTPNHLPSGKSWVFDHPFFLLLNVAIGGFWPGYPDESTVFPQKMMIDYVRVYKARKDSEMAIVDKDPNNTQSKSALLSPSLNHQMRGEVLQQLVPENAVGAEIGVHKGQFVRAILDSVKPAKLHLIDPWYLFGKEWEWAKDNRSTMEALIGILRAYEEELINGSIVLHIGYDLDILPTFPNQYFDWVYLDTSHQYEQTKRELGLLKLKTKTDGIIAGDDWHTDPDNMHHGVCQAVRELVENEPYEIVYADENNKQWAIRRICGF